MVKVVLMFLLAMTCTSAIAKWTKVGEYSQGVKFVNLANIQKDDNLVKMWILSDYKFTQHSIHNKRLFMSTESQIEFNCEDETSRILSITNFSGNKGKGEVVYSNAYFHNKWSPIISASIEKREWNIACDRH